MSQQPQVPAVPLRAATLRGSRGGSALAFAALVVAALDPASVRAHDPPEISRIYWPAPASSAGDKLVLRTNRGLIFGEPGSSDWRYMCGDAWGTPFGEQPDLAYLPDGRLIAATTQGLKTSSDEGCTWQGVEPFASGGATALVQHAADPNSLYLAVSDKERGGLYESQDAGATWTKRLNLGPADHVAQIVLSPAEPARIYLNGLVYDDEDRRFSFQITRSSDAGVNWTRSYVPLLDGEQEAILLAVSPIEPETLLVLAATEEHSETPGRVLISRDAGETFETLVQALDLRGGGFSVDGKTVFAVGNEAFYRSNAAPTEATPSGEGRFVSCVTPHDGALYVCGNHSGFDPLNAGVGVSMDDGASFDKLMAFTDVKRTVTCGEDSDTPKLCKNLWIDWQVEVLVGVGGAPLDSVPDWMSLDGTEPEPMSGRPTLSTAEPPATAEGASAAPVGAANAAPPPMAAEADEPGGCTVAPLGAGSGSSRALGAFAFGALWAFAGRRRRRRTY